MLPKAAEQDGDNKQREGLPGNLSRAVTMGDEEGGEDFEETDV